jgi:hypothetical protein
LIDVMSGDLEMPSAATENTVGADGVIVMTNSPAREVLEAFDRSARLLRELTWSQVALFIAPGPTSCMACTTMSE